MSSHEQRLARNEILFREVNERIEEISRDWSSPIDFTCECASEDCFKPMPMSSAAYEQLRQHPTRFAVCPGHERPEIEDVVERHPSYLVVEKHPETRDQAVATDPRS